MHIRILWKSKSLNFSLLLKRNHPIEICSFSKPIALLFCRKLSIFLYHFLTYNLIVRLIYAHKHSLKVEIRLFLPFFKRNHPQKIVIFSVAIAILFSRKLINFLFLFLTFNLTVRLIYDNKNSLEVETKLF